MKTAAILLVAAIWVFPLSSVATTNPVTLQTNSTVIGQGPKYIGYNQGYYMPAGNTTAWLKRAGINCLRVWTNPESYEPTDDIAPYGDGVIDQTTFDARRIALRADPENPLFINFTAFEDRFQNYVQTGVNECTANAMLSGCKSLGVATIVEMDSRAYALPGTWADRWEHWQKHYAMGYYMAKNFDVHMFETCNEPDQTGSPVSEAEYAEWTKFADDALRCAVLDVNTNYNKSLTPTVICPTLKNFSNIDTYGQTKLANIRTDYNGNPIAYDNFQVYCTHQYNATYTTFVSQLTTLQSKIPQYHAAGLMLPVLYTEYNRYNTSTWETQPVSVSLESPTQFCDIANILCYSMANGVWGMTSFKFSETYSSTFGKYRTGYHYVWDIGDRNVTGAKKAVDVMKLFAQTFAGQRDRLQISQTGTSSGYIAHAAVDTSSSVYRIYSNNASSVDSVAATYNLSALDIAEGTTVTIEEVSALQHGGVVSLLSVPVSRVVTATQPPLSVWLLTALKGTAPISATFTPSDDTNIQGGTSASTNFGSNTSMLVKTSTINSNLHRKAYLKFDMATLPADAIIRRALLQIQGRNPVDSTPLNLHLYGSLNDTWQESSLTWNSAPDHDPTTTTVTNQGTSSWPIGDFAFDGTDQAQRLDVTDFITSQTAGDKVATFILARETMFASDTADDGRHANMTTKENATASARPQLIIYYTSVSIPVKLSELSLD